MKVATVYQRVIVLLYNSTSWQLGGPKNDAGTEHAKARKAIAALANPGMQCMSASLSPEVQYLWGAGRSQEHGLLHCADASGALPCMDLVR